MAVVYREQTNPGAVKLLLRNTSIQLREFLDSLNMITDATRGMKAKPPAKAKASTAAPWPAEKRLFSNISDEEINQLFSFAENP